MPVRSLNSSVFTWPDATTVSQALHRWAQGVVQNHAGVVRIGYFGSYARSDWGVGSDLDVVIIVKASCHPFHQRALDWDVTALPVPADVMVYTQDEWDTMARAQERFFRTVDGEVIWVYGKNSMPQE
ncbi:MAG: nucleotidyltransferase domain-containing protein [Candidatus Latescibacteria bacterium]|nr:nucleotidyltransferase domain-containing protein [Candidatus Latescibacterota bacterium]